VIHIFEYLNDNMLPIFSSSTFPLNMFVLQHFQHEVPLFDMFSNFKLYSAYSAVGSYFHQCSSIFSYFQTFSAILFIFQLFLEIFRHFFLDFSFKLSDVTIPTHVQQEMHFLVEHAFHLLKTKLKGKCPKNKQN